MSAKLAKTFRRNVRESMVSLGLTQAELAKKLKVTPSYISQMLSGHRDPNRYNPASTNPWPQTGRQRV